MPFQITYDMQPKENSLVVCAGTVTCTKVEQMASGFTLFKKLFNQNISWKTQLQQLLDDYFAKKSPMPAYIRLAEQGTLIGGVATVPSITMGRGTEYGAPPNEEQFKIQYINAVRAAVEDAKKQKRPLFMQPLGIGVYGWEPQKAADLFAEAIRAVDQHDEVDITIPIFDQRPGSPDQLFKAALLRNMSTIHKRHPQGVTFNLDQMKPQEPAHVILASIVTTLIGNIKNKSNGRWTSGSNSTKVTLLEGVQARLRAAGNLEKNDLYFQHFVKEIMGICERKRNPLHFWRTPESVKEYTELLANNGIELPKVELIERLK